MVYDPVRDCEVPSPATALPGQQEPWRPYHTPGSAYTPGAEDPRLGGRSRPPAFNTHAQSPSAPLHRSTSAGLRSLLHEDVPVSTRRGSDQRSSMSSHPEEDVRPDINRLTNDTPAPGISKSSSASSFAYSSSPSNPSPRNRIYPLDHAGAFLAPTTPASAPTRTSRVSTATMSPPIAQTALPYHESYLQHGYAADPQAGPSRRSSTGQSYRPMPMMPPQETLQHPFHPHDSSLTTPGAYGIPLRSSSLSVSPRSYHQYLPGASLSQQISSTDNIHSLPSYPPDPPHASPANSSRRLSENHGSAALPEQTSSSGRNRHPNRRPSQSTPIYSPQYLALRSPSLVIPRAPYRPKRISQPGSVLEPIDRNEVMRLKSVGMSNNPLRRKKRRPLPSWSGPSPGTGTPTDSDISYFPQQDGERALSRTHRSQSYTERRNSGGQANHPVVTPGGAYPPAYGDEPVPSPPGPSRVPRIKQPRPRKSTGPGDGVLPTNHLKRASDGVEEPGHDTARRKVGGTQYAGNAGYVAEHYNSRAEVGVQQREFSPIIGLRKFNNWVKSVLIGKFAFRTKGGPGANVLDIGCGKGGDLNKWKQARIKLYVGLDLADMSIDQARNRYLTMNRPGFDAHFYAYDCYSKPISDILADDLKQRNLYDNVTMQFCMHYAFESASKARMMIENVSRFLRKGGLFIGTIPDAQVLLNRLEEVPEDDDGLTFGNSCYSVRFDERRHKGLYGHAYRFFLDDAVEDVPEFLVQWDNFEALASEYGLRLVYKKGFGDILAEEKESRDFGPLLGKMGVINEGGESAMDGAQWEAATLYMAFAFEKQ